MEIEYGILEKKLLAFLDTHKILVLATAANNRVSARSMSCVHIGLKICFQTSGISVKYQQIEQNPNVALCDSNVQIEGVAQIREHPLAETSSAFIGLYKVHHPGSFKTYSHLRDNVVIEVEPKLVTFWEYDSDGFPYREFLYLPERKAEREYYDISQ